MPPSWLLEAVEVHDGRASTSAEANFDGPSGLTGPTRPQRDRQPDERIELPRRPSLPEARERDELDTTGTIASTSAGGFDLYSHDGVYPDLNEFDRIFVASALKSTEGPSVANLGNRKLQDANGVPEEHRMYGDEAAATSEEVIDDDIEPRPLLDSGTSGLYNTSLVPPVEKNTSEWTIKNEWISGDIGDKLKSLSLGSSSSQGGEVDNITNRHHSEGSGGSGKEKRGDDPEVLWAIIKSLLDSKTENKHDLPKMPRLFEMTCKVCKKPTLRLCAGCHLIGYCSVEHQEKVRVSCYANG